MSFRVEITACGSQVFVACEGHLDAEAITAIQRAVEAAETAGQQAVIRLCRGATADRPVVARLAGYPVEQLEVRSPFLRSWLEELRADRARAAESASQERRAPGSEVR